MLQHRRPILHRPLLPLLPQLQPQTQRPWQVPWRAQTLFLAVKRPLLILIVF